MARVNKSKWIMDTFPPRYINSQDWIGQCPICGVEMFQSLPDDNQDWKLAYEELEQRFQKYLIHMKNVRREYGLFGAVIVNEIKDRTRKDNTL